MPAYTNLDSAAPDGTAGTGTTYSASDLANVRALRDAVIVGRVPGWILSRTQGTGPDVARPQYVTWLNATLSIGFRKVLVWGGTGNMQVTSVAWEWTSAGDYPGTWTTMGSAQVNTWDANDNVTATTNSGGWHTLFLEVWTKCLRVVSGLATHIAATGTAVHGLGTMSLQAASAVAINGGNINGTDIGQTTKGLLSAKRLVEDRNSYAPGAGAGQAVDWTQGTSYITNNGTNALTFSNVPATGQFACHTIRVSNLNNTTFPAAVTWGAGAKPSVAGEAWVHLWTVDGGAVVYAALAYQAV